MPESNQHVRNLERLDDKILSTILVKFECHILRNPRNHEHFGPYVVYSSHHFKDRR